MKLKEQESSETSTKSMGGRISQNRRRDRNNHKNLFFFHCTIFIISENLNSIYTTGTLVFLHVYAPFFRAQQDVNVVQNAQLNVCFPAFIHLSVTHFLVKPFITIC